MFIGTAICFVVMIGLVWYTDKKNGRPVWPGKSSFNDYVNANHHWHDWGHFLVQFFAVTTIMHFLPSFLNILAILTTIISVFVIEFILQKHPGQSMLDRLKEKDVQFDIATHFLGGLSAVFIGL